MHVDEELRGQSASLILEDEAAAIPQAEMDEMLAQIEADQVDPRTQSYFMRLDSKTVVKTEQEYFWCSSHGIPTKVISYAYATHLASEEAARAREKKAHRKANKTARAARKRNR